MIPVSPVLTRLHKEVVFAKDQPQYLPLPAVIHGDPEGRVITHWRV